MKLLSVSRVLFIVAVCAPAAARADVVLWYNGDLGNTGATANEQATNGYVTTFDNFNVTDPGGWVVDRVWSNDFMTVTGITQAAWSIRSGMGIGNAGTVVASGVSPATQVATGRTGSGGFGPEYTIQATGLNVYLSPGTYWLSVSPLVGNDRVFDFGGVYLSYNSGTLGVNAVGTPKGDDHNGLFFDPRPTSPPSQYVTFGSDYSMGVGGTVVSAVPEPSPLILAAVAGVAVLIGRRARRG